MSKPLFLCPGKTDAPDRTKITPPHRVGSPVPRLTYTPEGAACFKLALRASGRALTERLCDSGRLRLERSVSYTYNSRRSCCLRKEGTLGRLELDMSRNLIRLVVSCTWMSVHVRESFEGCRSTADRWILGKSRGRLYSTVTWITTTWTLNHKTCASFESERKRRCLVVRI